MYFNDNRTVSFKSNEEKLWITSYVKLVKLSSFCCPLLLFIYFSVVSVDILLIELEMSQTKFAVIVFQEVVSTIGWLMVSPLGNWLISVTSNFLTCTIIKFIYYCNRSLLSISYFYSEIKISGKTNQFDQSDITISNSGWPIKVRLRKTRFIVYTRTPLLPYRLLMSFGLNLQLLFCPLNCTIYLLNKRVFYY